MKTSILKRPGTALKLVAVGGGLVGLSLRFWLEAKAIDDKGLLISGHPAHTGLWVLGLGIVALMALWVIRYQPTPKKAPAPKSSTPAALGCIPPMLVLIWSLIQADTIPTIVLSALALAGLATVALCRFMGKKVPLVAHIILCGWLVFLLIQTYRTWSFDPQLHHYCFQLLAYVALTLTAYQHAAMDHGMGNQRKLWFWSVTAAFLCITTAGAGLQYLALAIWVLTDLPIPRLKKVPGR